MGKAKKRSLHLGINDRFSNLSRNEAADLAAEMLNTGDKDAWGLITLFGLSAEEILESGANYEVVKGMENLLK